jgi:hypothetical protein
MLGLTPSAEALLAEHHGVITARQLADAGINRRAIARLVDLAVLRRATRAVFVLAGSPATLHQRCIILSRTHATGFVTGPTAGTLAGLRRMPTASAIHFALRHGISAEPVLGVRFRQTTSLRSSDRVNRDDGIVVASPARLAFDLAADLRQLDHRSVVQQLLDRGHVSADQLTAIGRRLCHPARRGSTTFARTLATLGSGAPQDSHGEVELLALLRDRGVPVEAQVPVVTGPIPLHLDLGVADARWGVELDLHPEHRSLEGHRQDAARRRVTNERDWEVEIVTELDMGERERVADRLAVSYSRRVRRLDRLGRRPDRSIG